MEEGSRTVVKGAQLFPPPTTATTTGEVSGKPRSIIWWGGETIVGSARLGGPWSLGRNEECVPLVQLAVDEVLGLVGRGAG